MIGGEQLPKNAKHLKNRPRKSDTDEGKGRNVNHVRMKSVFDRGVDVYRAWKTTGILTVLRTSYVRRYC